MQTQTWRRCAATALLLAAATLGATGCDRRASDPALPSTTPNTTSPGTTSPDTTTPGTTSPGTTGPGTSSTMPGTLPDSSASAASR